MNSFQIFVKCVVQDLELNSFLPLMILMVEKNADQLALFGKASRTLVEEKYDVRFVVDNYRTKIEYLTGSVVGKPVVKEQIG